MEIKLLEIQDRATCIAAIAIRPGTPDSMERDPRLGRQAQFLLGKAGFNTAPSQNAILLGPLQGGKLTTDPYDHESGARTWCAAHQYIERHFDELSDGAIIDVRVITGEQPDRIVRSDAFWNEPEEQS